MARRPRSVPVGRPHVLIRSSSERSRGRGMVHSWAACKWAPRTRCRPREGRFPAVTPPAAPGLLLRLCAARGAEHPPAPWENRERGGRGEEDGVGEEGRRGEVRGREASGERGRRGGARGQKGPGGAGRAATSSWSLAARRVGARLERGLRRGQCAGCSPLPPRPPRPSPCGPAVRLPCWPRLAACAPLLLSPTPRCAAKGAHTCPRPQSSWTPV